ncbi:MAG: 50S ribosomal protein L25 [Nitrospirota bacterium]|nr:50S ribosomal protein L25 [Nitrospirota bacterium]MDH5767365.1 50S ribosomal protein L25 [Nitrospirota bacterium]
MERITINAEKREEFGKGAARSLRRKAMIPAVLYRGGEALPIKLSKKELTQFINTTAGEQVMVSLQFADSSNRLAIMKEYQLDPAIGELLHADFFEVLLTEEVKVIVHVTPVGESIGVKRDGGILQHLLREIEVECLPDKIPGHIKIDISGLEIGQSFHVKDLKLGEGIKVLNDPQEVIVNVIAPVVEEVAAPAEAVVTPEVTEPELIKKGKKEEEEEKA